MHAVRSGKRNRVEYGVGEPGQKPDQILLWDGEVARNYVPADRTLTVSKYPERGCLNLEAFYRDCTPGTDTVDFLRSRTDTVVERADERSRALSAAKVHLWIADLATRRSN